MTTSLECRASLGEHVAADADGAKTSRVIGWSRDCSAPTKIDYLYKSTGGEFKSLPAGGGRPADLAKTTTLDGKTVDYVVRRERGTINRFIYSITMLAPLGKTWRNRSVLEGLNASDTVPHPYNGGKPGSTECVAGWRGLTPLALNPKWTDGNDPEWQLLDPPGVKDTVKWTHFDDLRNVYGVGPDGFARVPWDNVGVQYGLAALRSGAITPAEFLDLNARVGTWKQSRDMVQEGCPFEPQTCADPAQFDPWSSRNMQLSHDDGVTSSRRGPDRDPQRLRQRPGLLRPDRHPDHRLAALPRRRAEHAQLPAVVRRAQADARLRRRRGQPGHLVHRRQAGAGVRPDPAGAGRDGPVDDQHPQPAATR